MKLTTQSYFNEFLQPNNHYDNLAGADNMFQEAIYHAQIETIKKSHPYAITPPPSEKGRWQTRFRDKHGKYKIVKAATEEKLFKKLAELYFFSAESGKIKFYDLFEEWLNYKNELTSSNNTILRHKQHYRKYLEPSKLHELKLRDIDSLILETECNRIIKEFSLSRKEWCNVKTILNGMFDFAVRKKYLSLNLMNDVRIIAKFRQVAKKSGKTQTFNPDEIANLNQYLDKMYAETGDTAYMAVKVNFYLGLRIGELTALKWSDWESKTSLHIIREEIRDQETNRAYVVEHTKTHTDRKVVVPQKAIEILEKLPRQGEYIFMRNNDRITCIQIAYILKKYAERQGIPTKSSHKIRKTYASNLATNGVPLDAIREQLGHSDLRATLEYIYNPMTEAVTYDLINKALQCKHNHQPPDRHE